MSEILSCLNCGAELGDGRGFLVVGELYITLFTTPAVCNDQCLIAFDATGPGLKGAQAFNLAEVELKPLS